MNYSILPLKFDTPIHFGSAEQGGDLTNCSVEYTADAVIAAILHELERMNEYSSLSDIKDMLDNRKLIFSDLLPYKIITYTGNLAFYLPKPIMIGMSQPLKNSLQETREHATKLKNQKKITFLRGSELSDYINGLRTGNMKFLASADFYDSSIMQKVFIRNRDSGENKDPIPYFVGLHKFRDNAGMYIIVGLEDSNRFEFIKNILNYVGLSGIGGKRSSGYGKFHIADDIDTVSSEDSSAILTLLNNTEAATQINISTLLPSDEDIPVLNEDNAWYKLKARSGFISGLTGEMTAKKNSIYMVATGSCLPRRIAGTKKTLGKSGNTDIVRYGYGMFVGV